MTSKPRISVTMEPELVEQIEAYRHSHRISTQSKAVQQLVREGFRSLANEKTPPLLEEAGLGGLDYQETELIRIARGLDPAQKALLLRLVETAAESTEKPRSQ